MTEERERTPAENAALRAQMRVFAEAYVKSVQAQGERMADHKRIILNLVGAPRGSQAEAWWEVCSLAKGWSDSKPGPSPRIGAPETRLYKKLRSLMNDLLQAEDKAGFGDAIYGNALLNELLPRLSDVMRRQPRPRHKGTQSPVPAELICDLARIFRQYRTRKPGAGDGPFAKLVAEFWQATGHAREYHTVIKDVQRAKKAFPPAFGR